MHSPYQSRCCNGLLVAVAPNHDISRSKQLILRRLSAWCFSNSRQFACFTEAGSDFEGTALYTCRQSSLNPESSLGLGNGTAYSSVWTETVELQGFKANCNVSKAWISGHMLSLLLSSPALSQHPVLEAQAPGLRPVSPTGTAPNWQEAGQAVNRTPSG